MGGANGHEHALRAQLRDVPLMNMTVGAPVQGVRVDADGCALLQHFPHEIQRRRTAYRILGHRNDAPAGRAYRKNRRRTEPSSLAYQALSSGGVSVNIRTEAIKSP